MLMKNILLIFIVSSFLFSSQVFEYTGVSVEATNMDNKTETLIVKRNIPDICKKIPITNEMLWTGNFAHKQVPEICKSTYVHTKGKLLPMKLDVELETYGELEVLVYLKEMQKNKNMVLIDSRTKKWFEYRTIPGAINMPFVYFKNREQNEFHFEYALKYLGVTLDKEGDYDFTNAKTVLLFCNGPWCSQSPTMIYALLEIFYPPEKIKWYRGGMQDWLGAGMTSTREVEFKKAK